MAIDERSRHELYLKLEQVLGKQEAATLMVRMEIVSTLQADFRAELLATQRHFVSWMIGLNLTLSGLVFAAAKFV